jgi:hypothetical protein
MHALIALWHQFVLRDRTLERMSPISQDTRGRAQCAIGRAQGAGGSLDKMRLLANPQRELLSGFGGVVRGVRGIEHMNDAADNVGDFSGRAWRRTQGHLTLCGLVEAAPFACNLG